MPRNIYEKISIVSNKSILGDFTNYLIQFVVSVDGLTVAGRNGERYDVIAMDVFEERLSDVRDKFVQHLADKGKE